MNDLSTEDIIWLLKRPFPAERVHWRIGSTNQDKTRGIALAYIDARDVMDRLDTVVGPVNWQDRYAWSDNGKLCCEIGIFFSYIAEHPANATASGWVWKSNGAGDTQFEADKGAFSDAYKRAAVMWGIGRYLYALPNEWVPIKQAGRSYKIDGNPPALPDWAVPNEFQSKQERDKWVTAMHKAWADRDVDAMRDYKGSLTNEQQLDIWFDFTPTQRREMKAMLKEEAA